MTELRPRQALINLCLKLSHRGCRVGLGASVAVRLDAHHFAIVALASECQHSGTTAFAVLRLSDLAQVEGNPVCMVASALHASILTAREDVRYSVHTNQPLASACARIGRPLTVMPLTLQRSLGLIVPVVSHWPSQTDLQSFRATVHWPAGAPAYLLKDRGALCCGITESSALLATEDLEILADLTLARLVASGGKEDLTVQAVLGQVADILAGGVPYSLDQERVASTHCAYAATPDRRTARYSTVSADENT